MPVITTSAAIPLNCCKDIEKIKDYLTIDNPEYVARARFGNFYSDLPDELLSYFQVKGDYIHIPRNFHHIHPELFTGLDEDEVRVNNVPLPNTARFKGQLRGYQSEYFVQIDKTKNPDMDILMEAPCGHGKTILGAYYATEVIRLATLILVPKYVLGEQWLATYAEHFEGLKVELATPNSFTKMMNTGIYPDVLIMSFDLFDSRQLNLDNRFIYRWGTIILDEAHTVGAPTYQPVLAVIPCAIRIAATATFRRVDGMHRILEYFFGQRFTMKNQFSKPITYAFDTGIDVPILFPKDKIPGNKKARPENLDIFEKWLERKGIEYKYYFNDLLSLDLKAAKDALKKPDFGVTTIVRMTVSECIKRMLTYQREYMFTTVDSFITRYVPRRRVLASVIVKSLQAGRKVLLLSKRKESLYKYKQLLEKLGYKVGIVVAETSTQTEYLKFCANEAHCVCAIYQIGKQGLDMPLIDTVILEHPFSDIEQIAGRSARDLVGKKRPMVLFPIDGYVPYKRLYENASKVSRNVDFCTPMELDDVYSKIS